MIGAIIGDIVGSVYEWNNIKTKNFTLFRKDCFFTDDTVMTVAVAEAIKNGGKPDDFINSMKRWGILYPYAGYGGGFGNWLFSDDREPYNSWGNGSAMRVAACGWAVPLYPNLADGINEVLELAKNSAEVTHNHSEGIKGAQATAFCIYAMRFAKEQGDIDTYKDYLRQELSGKGDLGKIFNYDMAASLDEIRPTYEFNESCQETVPQAIIAFLESTDFEDAIRNAISLGGDSDTLGAITGSIAEAAYGIPDEIYVKALDFLDNRLLNAISEFRQQIL